MQRKILLIDDDPSVRDVMDLLLRKLGYDPILVPDVLEGLECLKQDTPALILLDIMMSPINGWELLESLRADPDIREVPVILFTASPSVKEKISGSEDKCLGVLQKPVSLPELRIGIEKFLPCQ
jgi:CheY-like chemotaxis protein